MMEALIRSAETDSGGAFTLLYRQTAAAIHAYLYRLCGCPHLTADLLQETFLAAFRGLADFKGHASPRTWLYIIATNKFRDHCRNHSRRAEVAPEKMETLATPGPAPLEAAIQGEERRRIREAILVLAPELRATLLLVRFEGLKYREAAEALGTTTAAVRMQVHRAHRLLAQTLGEEAGHEQR
jgi:RNA polymerase sigma-70 factor (ECF subfamily)